VLEKGEALFHVTPNIDQPFLVNVGDRMVRDVGTIFDIVHIGANTTIVVAEGRVVVRPRDNSAQTEEVALTAGDRFQHADGTVISSVARVDAADAIAWRQGYLIYKNAPLSQVVNDLNRYFSARFDLTDNSAAAERFTGILKIDNETAMLKRLSEILPLTIDYHARKIALRAPAPGP
jgi:transmembrane sensor